MTVWDNQGNKAEKQITISNIDNTNPNVNISYSEPDDNGKVEVIISADKKISEKNSNNWTVINDTTLKRIYNESDLKGTEVIDTVIITDEINNQVEVSIKDSIAPRIVGEIGRELIGNGITKVEIELSEEIQEVENPGWELSEDKKHLTKEITEYEELSIKDLAGNENTIKIEPLNYNEQLDGLVEEIEEVTDKEEPLTEHIRVINLRRPIENVDLLELKDKVEYELSNENKTITLRFKKKVSAGQRIKLTESEDKTEYIALDKVSNVVIKGDSNNDGRIEEEDLIVMWKNTLGTQKQNNKYRIFAMDMNDDDNIDIADLSELMQILIAGRE